MKNLMIIIAVFTAFVFTSCGGKNNAPQRVEPETYCHTELVYHSLATAVVAVPYRVQQNDNVGEVVEMHKTDPNQVGGHFLDYNLEMFLADNPEVFASIKRSVRKDKCDPNKIDTTWYKAWNLKENDLVYLRIPACIDTVETPGPNVRWFNPEKPTRILHLTERTEIVDLKPKPVTETYKNLCPNEARKSVLPPKGDGQHTMPPSDESKSFFSQWFGFGFPWWLWIVIALLIIALAIWGGT